MVNEPAAPPRVAQLPARWQMAGKTGSAQVRRVSREERESGFNVEAAVGVAPARAVRRLCAV